MLRKHSGLLIVALVVLLLSGHATQVLHAAAMVLGVVIFLALVRATIFRSLRRY